MASLRRFGCNDGRLSLPIPIQHRGTVAVGQRQQKRIPLRPGRDAQRRKHRSKQSAYDLISIVCLDLIECQPWLSVVDQMKVLVQQRFLVLTTVFHADASSEKVSHIRSEEHTSELQ